MENVVLSLHTRSHFKLCWNVNLKRVTWNLLRGLENNDNEKMFSRTTFLGISSWLISFAIFSRKKLLSVSLMNEMRVTCDACAGVTDIGRPQALKTFISLSTTGRKSRKRFFPPPECPKTWNRSWPRSYRSCSSPRRKSGRKSRRFFFSFFLVSLVAFGNDRVIAPLFWKGNEAWLLLWLVLWRKFIFHFHFPRFFTDSWDSNAICGGL